MDEEAVGVSISDYFPNVCNFLVILRDVYYGWRIRTIKIVKFVIAVQKDFSSGRSGSDSAGHSIYLRTSFRSRFGHGLRFGTHLLSLSRGGQGQ